MKIDDLIRLLESDKIDRIKSLVDRRRQVSEELAKLSKERTDIEHELQRLFGLMKRPAPPSLKLEVIPARSFFNRVLRS